MKIDQCTHMGFGAHPDDLEIMAGHGILSCYENPHQHFYGVIVTNGAGTPSAQGLSQVEIIELRKQEQQKAAELGGYLGVTQLGLDSSSIKATVNSELVEKFKELIQQAQPKVIYTHNPFDKHQSHVAVTHHLLLALRQLDYELENFYGCEVWRGLDWLGDKRKRFLEIENPGIISDLIEQHKSQIDEAKDYPQASVGRMRANATFREAMQLDAARYGVYAIDLNPLLWDKEINLKDWMGEVLQEFSQEILQELPWK